MMASHLDIVRTLLEAGADINAKSNVRNQMMILIILMIVLTIMMLMPMILLLLMMKIAMMMIEYRFICVDDRSL